MPHGEAPKPDIEIPKVYQAEGRRLRQSTASEALLRMKAEEARSRLAASPEDLQAKLDFEESNLDLEIFDLTHDPTGALKREAIGSDLAKQLTEMMPAEGEPAPVASAESMTPVFLVNMGELDRLNKVSPDYGNEALTMLADQLSSKLEVALGPIAGEDIQSYYKIYRADNNSFMVRFMKPMSKEVAMALREHLSSPAGQAWEGEGDMFGAKGVETPPVIADVVSLEEVMAGLPPKFRTSGKAETYAVGAVKDVLFSLQDARKIVSRFERIRDIKNDDEARALYDKFLKKSLAGVFEMETGPDATPMPVETFEQFRAYQKSLEADPAHAEMKVWETAFGKVLTDVRIRYEKDGRYAKQLQNFVTEKVKKEQPTLDIRERRSSAPPGAELPPDVPVPEFVRPDRKSATEGLREIAALEAEISKAPEGSQEARVAQKRLERERAKRDYATGLELRGPMFKRLESALEDGSKRVATVSMDMGFLKYFDQVGGRETGDLAILKVAEVFQKIKDSFSKDGIEISTHRLGGDEFGMTVVGESDIASADFAAKLSELRFAIQNEVDVAGRIPPMEGAKPGYYATKLNVGVGVHYYEDGAAAAAEDARYELSKDVPDELLPGLPAHEAWVRNKRAEHLVKVADKVMGFQKASNRLNLMLGRIKALQESRAADAPEESIRLQEEHLKQLLAFSDKAIFGQTGRDMLKQWEARLRGGETVEALDEDVHEFVWDQMEAAFQEEVVERGDLEASVEYAVRIEYLKERVDTLTKKLGETGEKDESERIRRDHEAKRLKERLGSAEEDLEKMKRLRATLGG